MDTTGAWVCCDIGEADVEDEDLGKPESEFSMLTRTSCRSGREGTGDTGDSGVASRLSGFRKFKVTLLETGSVGAHVHSGGVWGASEPCGSVSTAGAAVDGSDGRIRSTGDPVVAEDPDIEVRRRFLAEAWTSSSSLKGLGRVDAGSEEIARSRESGDLES